MYRIMMDVLQLKVDHLVVAVGIEPNTELVIAVTWNWTISWEDSE